MRFLSFWFLNFLAIYAASVSAVLAWQFFGQQPIFLAAGMIVPPLVTLFFGWLYFRRLMVSGLFEVIKKTIFWIVLDFLGNASVFLLLTGAEPMDVFSTVFLATEAANFLALLLAGYLTTPRSGHSIKA